MINGKRIAVALALAGAAYGLGLPAATAQGEGPHADELSSVKWRDCAGHFFFLAKMTGNSEDNQMSKKLQSWGVLAVYASETKAKAEAAEGDTSDGRGKSMADAETGQLKVDVPAMVGKHADKAKEQGQKPYVESYSAQCGKPIQAYAQRFMKKVQAEKEKEAKQEKPGKKPKAR